MAVSLVVYGNGTLLVWWRIVIHADDLFKFGNLVICMFRCYVDAMKIYVVSWNV